METISKKVVILGLRDVLVPFDVVDSVPKNNLLEILKNLSQLENEGKIKLFLVSGMKREEAGKKLSENSLSGFFRGENIRGATPEYICKREIIDQKRYEEAIRKDPFFCDEYLKVQVVQSLISEGIFEDEIVYFGHDLMHDAFYLNRYCNVDTALVRQSLSFNNKKAEPIKGLIYADLTWPEFKKVIYGERKAESYEFLKARVFSEIKEQLFGGDLVKKITLTRK